MKVRQFRDRLFRKLFTYWHYRKAQKGLGELRANN